MTADRIAVDPSALETLARDVSTVHDSLAQAKSLFSDPYGGIADHFLLDALEHFNASWNQKRGHLENELVSAADALSGAAETFRNEDARLAAAASNSDTQGSV